MIEPIVDLRSDTVTRPTPAMRRAIAEAVVGDDVLGDDPTVRDLERRVADLAGKDAALFVPSGTMGNQIAICSQTTPGDEVLLEAESHIFQYEQGGVGANAGCLAHVVSSDRGAIDPATLEDALREDDEHVARVSLICVENTHNRHGGRVVPLERIRALATTARARGIRVHFDGARLWNASVQSGIPIREWALASDTLMMCFSKGLGAPIGSILTGPGETIARARRLRKRFGGGMRQVGILAAACLYAIDAHVERLVEDHRRAGALARGLAACPGVSVLEPETNIVLLDLVHRSLDPVVLEAALEARGVRLITFGARRLRAITHLDVDDEGIERAVEVIRGVLEETIAAPAGEAHGARRDR